MGERNIAGIRNIFIPNFELWTWLTSLSLLTSPEDHHDSRRANGWNFYEVPAVVLNPMTSLSHQKRT
jgi:hypothetical protein